MKKKILLFLFFLVIPFIFPNKSIAACTPLNGPAALCGTRHVCNISLTENYCCDTQAECNNLRGGTSDTNQPLNLEQIQTGAFPTGTYGVGTTIGKIISNILPYVFTITGILILIYLLMGGFQLMFAAGDPKKVQGAWGKITNAIIGFVIIFIAYWLTQLIGKVFNISIINTIFP